MTALLSQREIHGEETWRKRRLSVGLGYAYATLGLRAGEARVDAIRQAARKSASEIQVITQGQSDQIESLADVAVSAYLLLDPRKRVRRIERIQLSIPSERALELPQNARRKLLSPSGRRLIRSA